MYEEAYYYDFGDVAVGTKKIHKINVHNETSVLQCYSVDLDQNTNSYVSKSFCIKPMTCGGIDPNTNIEFQVIYHARTPGDQNRYYFTIIRSDGFHTNVSLKASSVGPKVGSSTTTLTFNCIEKNQIQSKCFYLMNKGVVPALYNLNNNSFGQLKIEPLYGCIPPSEKIRVIVTFKSKNKKTHYFKLIACLILYQSPILINVINIAESDKNKIDLNKMVITPETVAIRRICEPFSGRSSYQSDLFSLVSVKEEYVNFGSCTAGKCITKDLLVTNACGVNIAVIWEEDESGVFSIIATKDIAAFSKGNIAVKFSPPVKDKLYFSKLSASIFWGQYLTSIRATISLLGNSFENPSCGWLTQYEIEPSTLNIESNLSNIILPGCFPYDLSMSTFLIRRNAQLPLSFTFHPPPHSQFILKPMQGLIRGCFQIITVLMIGSEFQRIKGLNFHKEMWTIKFNESGLTHRLLLEGCIDESKLIVNSSLPVTFPKTHPLCSQVYSVTVRNPTQNTLRYSFHVTEGKDLLKVERSENVIESNQFIEHNWIFTPPSPGMYEGEVTCHCSDNLKNKFNFPIKFFGHCKEGHLKTEPTFFSMASVVVGTWENEIFHLINDGECTLHVTLDYYPCTLLSLKGETYLEPSKITINPGDSVKVEVCTTPGGLNHHDIQIGCYYRLSEVSDVILENSWTPLIRFDVIGVYPELIISDVRLTPLNYITKYNIWKIMEINRINQLWKTVHTLLQNQKTEIYLPSSTENSSPLLILILIKNISEVPADLSIFQEKTCDCKKIEKQFGINIFKMVSVCQHKKQITLNPQKVNIKECTSVTLAVEVHYNLVGEQEQTFCFKINPENMPWLAVSLTITFIRYAIPKDEPMIWPALPYRYKTKESHFKMIPVFIGQQKPLVQAYWVYNSTCHSIDYNISEMVPNNAFSCINSTGIIKPFSLHPLLFTFISYELNEYKACFKLETRYLQLYIYVECDSSDNFSKANVYKMLNKLPLATLFSATSIQLTMDHIVFLFLPLHSTAEKIFYLNNFTGEKLYISWTRVDLPGILYLRVVPKKSYIEPFECVLFKVTCKTSYQPCLITCNLICKVFKLNASGNFDVCTLETDNKQDRKNTCFNKTDKTLIGLSVTVHANSLIFLNLNNIMKYKMGAEIADHYTQNKQSSLLSREVADIITDIFGKILWNIVSSPYVQHALETGYPPIYYEEFLQNKENDKRIAKCPLDVTRQIFSNIISQLVSECFIRYLP